MSAAVDNGFYDHLGRRWVDDPHHAIALLVAEAPVKLAFVRSVLGGRPGPQRILDVGCGAGLITTPLAAAGHDVVGIDRSASTLEVARSLAEEAGSPAVFRVGDALRLDAPDASVDVVLLLDLIEHVEDHRQLIGEAARVARPGGSIVFHTFSRNPAAYAVAVLGPRLLTRDCPRHLHVYHALVRPRELRRAFALAGAPVTALHGVQPRLDRALLRTARHRRVDPAFGFRVGGPAIAGYIGEARRGPMAAPSR